MSDFISRNSTQINNNFVSISLKNELTDCNISKKSFFGLVNNSVDIIKPSIPDLKMYRFTKAQDLILREMLHHINYKTGELFITRKGLAEKLGITRKTVQRAYEVFIDIGMLTSEKQIRQPNGHWGYCQDMAILADPTVGHFLSHTFPKGNYKERSYYNNNENNSLKKLKVEEVMEMQAQDVTQEFKKEFDIESFWPSKKNQELMKQKGVSEVGFEFWVKEFREIMRRQKPWDQAEKWDFGNANYSFEKFFRLEHPRKNKLGTRYISLWKRLEHKKTMKATVEKEAVDPLEKFTSDPELKELMSKVLERLGKPTFMSWVHHLDLESRNNGIWRFIAPLPSIATWVGNNYLKLIKECNSDIKTIEIDIKR